MKNILIVVDMQNGFIRELQNDELVGKISSLISRNVFDVVIGTKFYNSNDSSFETMMGWSSMKSEYETEISNDILEHLDSIKKKTTYNCVDASFIQELYSLNGGQMPEKVFIVGVDTDCCVLMTATSLFEYGIRPVVLKSYCESTGGNEAHRAGIKCLERLIGKEQLVSGEVYDRHGLNAL